ncbi:uncharacterized protein LOC142169786 [Nicotiana tabacum]|uniref:Uncharacterized protein LOC142169786 n=1 Tax=Nicotiana tabacum TaxID=4097 RepID=A0AC58SS37_TOBAC
MYVAFVVPMQGYNVNSNRAAIPSMRTRNPRANYGRGRMPILRGSSSRSGRDVIQREYTETNHQNQNISRSTQRDHRQEPQNPRTIPIRNRLYDPSYAEIGQPVDPYLRLMELNPNFCNNRDNK